MASQYRDINQFKCEEMAQNRMADTERRRQLDEQIRQAHLADYRLLNEKRNSLRQLQEDDLRAKTLHKLLTEAKDQGVPAQEAVSIALAPNSPLASTMSDKRHSRANIRSPLLTKTGASMMFM